ncbi:MAG TPA: hypothetical protein VGR98_03950, partial [Streptosporangiaceae bacterium]|nr:hypothetical protein [Streptosporangiaceae bacterium]
MSEPEGRGGVWTDERGAPATSEEGRRRLESAPEASRKHSRLALLWAARAAALVLVIGGWQLLTTMKIVDPFFWGQPSGIVRQLNDWLRHGTAYGSIWLQIWITMKEAVLGFVFGVAVGVVTGVLLGQVRFLSDVVSPFIKVVNAIP